jgi:Tat protein translocase TatB subunit
MFNIGFPELLIIVAIALIVFGPNKLPELAKAFGKAMREFKKATEEVKESFSAETKDLEELKNTLHGEKEKFLASLTEEIPESIREASESPKTAGDLSVDRGPALTEDFNHQKSLFPPEQKKREEEKRGEPKGPKEGIPSNG